MKTIESVDKKICTGCGACYNTCPKEAIKMQPDGEGFLFPVIDHNKCVDCGICLKSCAAYNPHYKNEKEPKCYAVWASDEIRMKSSSGGVFTLLANRVLEQGGYVCGAAWDENFNVEHIVIHDEKDLWKLNGSKYVQSNTKKVFNQIKDLLKDGYLVLFSGVPCQVAGLYHFLQKDYENLFTVDTICHGVPSPEVWQDYLKKEGLSGNISNVNFRPKQYGWGTNFLEFTRKDNRKKLYTAENCTYLRGFKQSLFVRNCCASCTFFRFPRQADITMADFWGVDAFDKKLNDNKGTSLVIPNSSRGKMIFEGIRDKLTLCREIPLQFAIQHQVRLQCPLKPHYGRTKFFQLRRTDGYEKAADYALNNKYDVGIIGIWFFENYGAVITDYVLYKIIENMGFIPLLIDLSGFQKNPRSRTPNTLPRRFLRRRHITISGIKSSKRDLLPLNQIVESWVLASDQLWHFPKPFGKTFFLDFASDDKRKVSIATSFGEDYLDPKNEWPASVYHMRRLDRISVREDKGVEICKEVFGVKAEQLLDPVFLCDRNVYEELIETAYVAEDGNYLLCYILDGPKTKHLQEIADKLDLKLVILTDASINRKGASAQQGVEVEDWLYYFKHATAVITDSFHGTCFALLFHKPFLVLINQVRGASRFSSLMRVFREEERLLTDVEQLTDHLEALKSFDGSKFENILQEHKEHDLRWIHEALTFDKRAQSISTYDILSRELFAPPSASPAFSPVSSPNKDDIALLLNRRKIMWRYQRYKIMKEITWGKKRIKYRFKYQKAKEQRRKLKDVIRKYEGDF